MQLQENVSLAPLTTIGIGGPARFFFRATGVDELREALEWAREEGLRVFILGGGSNLLISDAGFDGLVIQLDLRGITVESEDAQTVMVKAAASEPWDPFVAYTVANEWAGVECLSGIPGSTGATPIQNVGAYGQDVSETRITAAVAHDIVRQRTRVDLAARAKCWRVSARISSSSLVLARALCP
jgi:UDP-N-acetylmuramate dehydrogenase